MQPMLSSFARMLTKRKDVRVVIHDGAPMTDGTTIYFRPPMSLGDNTPHQRRLCDKRDDNRQLLCPACQINEDVMCDILHEISHIAFNTFAKPSEKEVAEVFDRAIAELGTRYADVLRKRIDSAPRHAKSSYLGLASLISPFLPTIVNSLEDARIDSQMFSARKGTRVMFEANVSRIFSGEVVDFNWKEAPLNQQIIIGLFVKGCSYNYTGWLDPRVEAALEDRDLSELIAELSRTSTAQGVYRLSFRVLARLRELGFCRMPDEPQEELPPADNNEEQNNEDADGDADADSDTGTSDESGESPDTEDGDGGAGDASGEGAGDNAPGLDSDSEEGSDATDADGSASMDSDDAVAGDEGSDGDGTAGGSDDDGAGEPGEASGDESSVPDSPADSSGESNESVDGSDQSEDDTEGGEVDSDQSESTEDTEGSEGGTDAATGGDDGNDGNDLSGGSEGRSGGDTRGDEAVSDSCQGGGGGGFAAGDISDNDSDTTSDVDEGAGSDGESDAERSPVGDGEVSEPSSQESTDGSEPDNSGSNESLEQSDNEGDVPGDRTSDQDNSSGDLPGSHGDSGHAAASSGSGLEDVSSEGEEDSGKSQSNVTASDDGEQGSSELIDTGADAGEGGVQVIEEPEPESLPDLDYGTPEDAAKGLTVLHDEGLRPKSVNARRQRNDEAALDQAIVQGLYFETPSRRIHGVRVHHFDKPMWDGGKLVSSAWAAHFDTGRSWTDYLKEQAGIHVNLDLPESVLGPALMRMRRVFDDNKRADKDRNRKSGRVDSRVLGKRAWKGNDERLFHRRNLPGKRDYAVLIGVDVSGSTIGENLALAKRAARAQGELCHRLGIKWSMFAHSGNLHDVGAHYSHDAVLDMDIYVLKEFDEPWNKDTQKRLVELGPSAVNLDGHTIEYYRKVIENRRETDKIIMYYTDGKMPAENHDEELEILLRELQICKRKNITLMGVGIRTDSPKRHGLDTVQVFGDTDIENVVKHLEKRLATR
jgi:hypothetical protein